MKSFRHFVRCALPAVFGLTLSFAFVADPALPSVPTGINKEAPEYQELFGLLGLSEKSDSAAPSVTAALLVSFSMPMASLERLARDAKDAGIPLVFRGVPQKGKSSLTAFNPKNAPAGVQKLINPEALKAFEPLVALGSSVELNPELFSDHGITQVPALLLKTSASKNTDDGCARPASALVIRGDATLGYLLDQVTDRKDPFGEAAKQYRELLGGRQ